MFEETNLMHDTVMTLRISKRLSANLTTTASDIGWTKSDLIRFSLETILRDPVVAKLADLQKDRIKLTSLRDGPK
jgi:hypothetical protein